MTVEKITCFEDAQRAFPDALGDSDGWLWDEGSEMGEGITLWCKSNDKRLLVVEVTDAGSTSFDDTHTHYVFVDDEIIEYWSEYSIEHEKELAAAEARAREFVENYRV